MVKSNSGLPLSEHVDAEMCNPEGVALGGYDVVSYREDGGPLPGDQQFSLEHEGATYLFASQVNLERFVKDPKKYLPGYSGFCAITLALGRVTCPDYTNFKIENDQLLLFEVTGFTNGRTLWNSDAPGYRQQADHNYLQILKSP